MSPSQPSSTCATHGSVKSFDQANPDTPNTNSTSSNSEQRGSDTARSHTTTSQEKSGSSDNQREHSASRIATFLEDKIDSQIIHRDASVEASSHEHTTRIAASIDEIDEILTRSEG